MTLSPDGVVVYGVPIGSDEFIRATVSDIAHKHIADLLEVRRRLCPSALKPT